MRIGPYEIEQEIGRGGMGTVFRARAPSGALVAVKLLKQALDPDARARFDRERRLQDALGEAAGFVPLLDWGQEPRPFIVMPLLTGGTLRDRFEKGPLGLATTLELARPLAAALGRAHELRIVHRDLKPENVLFTGDGRPLIGDLGVAKHFAQGPHVTGISESVRLSRSGEARGTAGYMAPEQVDDATRAGPESDVFALGVIIYECLAGVPPFMGRTAIEAIARSARGQKVPLRELRPDVPEWLEKAVDCALARNRSERFPSGNAFAQALGFEATQAREARNVFPIEVYALREELGRGGAATVHKAIAPDGTACAMKLFKPGAVDRKKFEELKAVWASAERREMEQGAPVNRLRGVGVAPMKVIEAEIAGRKIDREAEMMAELGQLPGFVPFLAVGHYRGQPCIVMPLLPGGTLRDRMRRFGAMPVAEALRICAELARAMQGAHALGIVHRDLKPENVLFTEQGTPRISDMGLAKYVKFDDASRSATKQTFVLTKTGEFRGTVGYAAPEQMNDASSVGPGTDVYALGAILYECLAGEPLIQGERLEELWSRGMLASHLPLRTVRKDVPKAIADVVERCVQKNPADRYPDARMLTLALEERDVSESSLSEGAPLRRLSPLARYAAVVLGLALVALATLAMNALRKRTPVDSAEASPRPSASPTPQTPPKPSPAALPPDTPRWFAELPEEERPALPLPPGLKLGPGPGEYTNVIDGSVLLYVPHGVFVMGSNDDRNSSPAHEVELSAYFVGKYEVTNGQFSKFVAATGYTAVCEGKSEGKKPTPTDLDLSKFGQFPTTIKGTWRNPEHGEHEAPPNHPVVCVTWDDAKAYLRWAKLDLPTEAQWERAAAWDPKAKKSRKYSWGDFAPGPGDKVGNVADLSWKAVQPDAVIFPGYNDGWANLAPVGSFPLGASPCGALDMTGNAVEWCEDACDEDAFPPYPSARIKDPLNLGAGINRIIRGGDCTDGPGDFNPMTTRRHSWQHNIYMAVGGFRAVRNTQFGR